MRGLDDTDREILQLLLEDSRRPFSDIAAAVDLSAPAVSDRVERLQEIGVIRGFTLDIDRSLLEDGTPVLVTIRCVPGAGSEIRAALASADAVQHLFQTADDTVVCTLLAPGDVGEFLRDQLPIDAVREFEVDLLEESDWTPRIHEATLRPECVECGNTVSAEGERETLDGTVYHFCCPSCRDSFVEQYEALSEGA